MKRFLHTIARTWMGGLILHWIIACCSFVIPGEKLVETEAVIAFHHPSPSYPLHILILPRSNYRSLADLPSPDLAFESGLFQAVSQLVQRFGLEDTGYRLIANGGRFQEVYQLHFHLVSENFPSGASTES